MNRYIVQQPYRGVTTFSVLAETAAEALEKVNERSATDDAVECLDRETVWIGKAAAARLEQKNVSE